MVKGKKQPQRQKHVPQRSCIICRRKTDKRQLTRIVLTADEGMGAALTYVINRRVGKS